ncbi:diguanylate cyclase [Chromobacterium sp. IIBBL 290-4]|uniref:GGDEF domain-containing protein n=1 Tax=Chromobacterium sp. IIBBL 290-4 TaxID=2953890 RepID=UPI0020B8BFEA|nr:sensor domain-containing diguanylate cyclase [Chromobacterium sp. IIBBL 290-4]UTH73619.1 diguanylate cyclase [Chromobacterium sp. IIBBL 290-4]
MQNPSLSELQRRLFHGRFALLADGCGLALIALGASVTYAWLARLPAWMPENIHMVLSTAFCLMLFGAALLLAPLPLRWKPHRLLAAAVSLVCLTVLLEHMTGQSWWIDLAGLHSWQADMVPRPGQMAASSSLALLMLCASLGLHPGATPAREKWERGLLAAAAVIGVLGATAYLINLELLYSWGAQVRMALLTAGGILLACLGLYCRLRSARPRHLRSQEMVHAVSLTATVLLVAVSLITGLLVYRIGSEVHEQSLLKVMSYGAQQRAALLSDQFDLSYDIERRIYQRPEIQSLLEQASLGRLPPQAADTLAALNHMTLNGIAIQDRAGKTLAQVGYFELHPRQFVSLRAPAGASLLWNGHYLYRTVDIYKTSAGEARLVQEQRMDLFDRLVAATRPNDALSGIYSLCGRDNTYLRCFSQSIDDKGSTIPIQGNIRHFTVWPAFYGQRGTIHTVDFSGRDVIGAYEPVSDTGLAFSYKIRVRDLLTPIRKGLETSALLMLAMVTLGALILRWRTDPLLREVQQSNHMAELAAERFRNAAEANMDAFVIMEAERDGAGEPWDFRIVYINSEAERLWQLQRDSAIGQRFLPLTETHGIPNHFEHYKSVLESGRAVSEDLPKSYDITHPAWIHHEIVKAGDGVSISVRDITQRKLAELDLVLREALLKSVTDSIPALVAFIDTDLRYRYCNKSYMKMFGISPERVIGNEMQEFLGQEAFAILQPHVQQALAGLRVSFECEMPVRGEQRYVEGRLIPQQHADGCVSGFYLMIWDVTQSRVREMQLRNQVSLDPMTGLLNRSAFMEMLNDEIAHHYMKRQALALLFLDIDHFKQVNDTLGHAAGDELIKEFARRLRANVRGTDHVARLGGDEFVILLIGLDSEHTAVNVVSKLLAAASQDTTQNGERWKVSTSIGVAYAATPDVTPERLLEIADEALYDAKAAGRNTFRMRKIGPPS